MAVPAIPFRASPIHHCGFRQLPVSTTSDPEAEPRDMIRCQRGLDRLPVPPAHERGRIFHLDPLRGFGSPPGLRSRRSASPTGRSSSCHASGSDLTPAPDAPECQKIHSFVPPSSKTAMIPN